HRTIHSQADGVCQRRSDAGKRGISAANPDGFAASGRIKRLARLDAPGKRGIAEHCYASEERNPMRVGVFTPLLSQFPLDKVFEKLRSLNISTVELGTGNYPGDPHCKLSMLQDKTALKEFKQKFADNGFTISALSSHGNPLHPDRAVAKRYAETSKLTI